MRATIFDGDCFVEGTQYYEQIMLMHWRASINGLNGSRTGVNVISEFGSQTWERCGSERAGIWPPPPESELAWTSLNRLAAARSGGGEIVTDCSAAHSFIRVDFGGDVAFSSDDFLAFSFSNNDAYAFPRERVRSNAGRELEMTFSESTSAQREFYNLLRQFSVNRTVLVSISGATSMTVSLLGSASVLEHCIERIEDRLAERR